MAEFQFNKCKKIVFGDELKSRISNFRHVTAPSVKLYDKMTTI